MNEPMDLIHFNIKQNLIASQILFMKQLSKDSLLNQELPFKKSLQIDPL